MTIIVACNPCV